MLPFAESSNLLLSLSEILKRIKKDIPMPKLYGLKKNLRMPEVGSLLNPVSENFWVKWVKAKTFLTMEEIFPLPQLLVMA
jgi:hypothetical protein